MRICRTIAEWERARRELDLEHRIGFVPTMGALHAGHLSLMAEALRAGLEPVVSIFVNRTQFGPNEDFGRYPRNEAGDLEQCHHAGVRAVFIPDESEMYPRDAVTRVCVAELTEHLCGPHRPGHFEGVATVVTKLLNIIRPRAAFFGRKDYQQLAVIRRLARDLNLPVEIVGCPIVREFDGLAMSSRNRYLSPEERHRALSLQRALLAARTAWDAGERSAKEIESRMALVLREAVDRIDYASVVDAETLHPVVGLDRPAIAAIAAWVGRTRLIDNVELG